MSTAVGFRFLYDAGYIFREMEDWFNVGLTLAFLGSCFLNDKQCRNLDYVVEVEVFLSKAFNFANEASEDEELQLVLSLEDNINESINT
jgi:large subunit ribosomal protein L17e